MAVNAKAVTATSPAAKSPASAAQASAARCQSLKARVSDAFEACGSAASNPILAKILGDSCTSSLHDLQTSQCAGYQDRIAKAASSCRVSFDKYKNWLKTQCRQALEPFLGTSSYGG